MAGGAFRNSGNLLGRKREIDDLLKQTKLLKQTMEEYKARLEEIKTAETLLALDEEEAKAKLQEQYLLQNTARMNVNRAKEQWEASENVFNGLQSESRELDQQASDISANKKKIAEEIE